MQVVNLKSIEPEIFQEKLEETDPKEIKENYYLVDKNIKLHNLIEQSGLQSKILHNLKLAHNISFDADLLNNNKKIPIKNMQELLEKIKENEEYKLLVKSDKQGLELYYEIVDILQELIYLKLHMDVTTEEELKYVKYYENFNKVDKQLLQNAQKLKDKINSYEVEDEDVLKTKEDIVNDLEELINFIKNLQKRKLNIVVMALAKVGKSLLVDALLGDEYAPTSLTQSTPNSIIYEEWDKDYIEVKIEANPDIKGYEKEQKFVFNTPSEVKNKLNKIFNKAMNDDENSYSIPDIYIKIPNKSLGFRIIDTPGPNVKGADHAKIAKKWLEKADAIVYLTDVSKGVSLTPEDEEFFKEVKSTLYKYERFNSLIFGLNQIDRLYEGGSNKSIIQNISHRRERLKNINKDKGDENGHKIPIIATSLLVYVNALQFKDLVKKYLNKDFEDTNEFIRDAIDEFDMNDDMNDNERDIYSKIDFIIKNLRRYHNISEPTIKDVIEFSRVPYFLEKIKYTAKSKVITDYVGNVVSKMDILMFQIANKIITARGEYLQEKREELLQDLAEMGKFFEEQKIVLTDYIDNNKLKNEIIKNFQDNISKINQDIKSKIETIFDNILQQIKDNNGTIEKNITSDLQILISDIENELERALHKNEKGNSINELKGKFLIELENSVKEIYNNILEQIQEKNFKKKYKIDILVPQIDPRLSQEKFMIDWNDVNKIIEEISNRSIEFDSSLKLREILDKFSGAINRLANIFTDEEMVKENRYEEELENIQCELNKKTNEIVAKFNDKLRIISNEGKDTLTRQLKGFQDQIKDEGNKIIESFEKIYTDIQNNLNKTKEQIEKEKEFIKKIKQDFDTLSKTWKKVTGE